MSRITQPTGARTPAIERHRRMGHDLIPLHRWDHRDAEGRERGKSPRDTAWRQVNYAKFDPLAHDGNVGVRLRATDLVVDVDHRHFCPIDGDPTDRFFRDMGVDKGACPIVVTGSGGEHYYLT